jgi:hypothetical protein
VRVARSFSRCPSERRREAGEGASYALVAVELAAREPVAVRDEHESFATRGGEASQAAYAGLGALARGDRDERLGGASGPGEGIGGE